MSDGSSLTFLAWKQDIVVSYPWRKYYYESTNRGKVIYSEAVLIDIPSRTLY